MVNYRADRFQGSNSQFTGRGHHRFPWSIGGILQDYPVEPIVRAEDTSLPASDFQPETPADERR
jgi:hypothetical protein